MSSSSPAWRHSTWSPTSLCSWRLPPVRDGAPAVVAASCLPACPPAVQRLGTAHVLSRSLPTRLGSPHMVARCHALQARRRPQSSTRPSSSRRRGPPMATPRRSRQAAPMPLPRPPARTGRPWAPAWLLPSSLLGRAQRLRSARHLMLRSKRRPRPRPPGAAAPARARQRLEWASERLINVTACLFIPRQMTDS